MVGGAFLLVAADLADEYHGPGLGVVGEELQQVDDVGADHGVGTHADHRALADAGDRQQTADFVAEGAAARDHAHRTAGEELGRHDAEFGALRSDDARGRRSQQAAAGGPGARPEAHGAVDRHAFGDQHYQGHSGGDRFGGGGFGGDRRHKEHGGVERTVGLGIGHGSEDRHAFHYLSGFARGHARDDAGTGLLHVPGLDLADAAGDALHADAGVGVDQYGHQSSSSRRRKIAATASSVSMAVTTSTPACRRISQVSS